MSDSPAGHAPPGHPRHRAAVIFIFVTVLIDILSFGIIIPVLPHLIVELTHLGEGRAAIARASVWVAAFGTVFMLMQFVCSPIQGALSDRYGRRVVILISSFGLGADFIVMALAPVLWLLFVGRVISGMCAASFTTANAYIADITPHDRRAAAFGLLGAAFAIGFFVGPALGGLLGHISIRLPFFAAACLSLINFCYGFFVLPESLPPEHRSRRLDLRHANPLGSLALLRRYPQVFGIAAVFFLVALAQFSINSVYVLYTDYRYAWGPQKVGYTLALVGLCTGIVQGLLVRRWTPKFGERRMLLAGVACAAVGYLGFGMAASQWVFVAAIPVLCMGGLFGPAAQALVTHQVDAAEQGRLQGALTSLQSLAGIFGPAVFANLFAWFISTHPPVSDLPGVPFLLAAALTVAAFALTLRVTRAAPTTMPAGGR